jgi:hypothetical protein
MTKRHQQREEAIKALPLKDLAPQVRRRIAPLIGQDAIHRRLATEVLRCDPQLYQFLIDQPEVTVAIWRELGISKLELRRIAEDQYEVSDQKGLRGRIQFLYRSAQERLIWFEGVYRNPLTPRPLAATVLVLLRSASIRESDGHTYVAHRLDAFLKLDSDAAELFLRILEPFTASQAHRNFSQIGDFLTVMSALGARRPQWVHQLADRLEMVSAEQRNRLREVVNDLAEHSAKLRQASRAQSPSQKPKALARGEKSGSGGAVEPD